jgi:hypothetical protein
MAMGPVNRMLASVPGFTPPEWWPAASNPTIQVSGAADRSPGRREGRHRVPRWPGPLLGIDRRSQADPGCREDHLARMAPSFPCKTHWAGNWRMEAEGLNGGHLNLFTSVILILLLNTQRRQ